MKKLNKKQKDYLKKSLLKGLNISCYVITGLALTLGFLLGINSCSKGDKNVVSTTPVVNEVINQKNSINSINLDLTSSYSQVDDFYYYAEYFDDKSYYVSLYDFDTIHSDFFTTLEDGDIIYQATNYNGSPVKAFNISGGVSEDEVGHDGYLSFDNDYYKIEFVGLYGDLPNLRFYRYDEPSVYDYLEFDRYIDGRMDLDFYFYPLGRRLCYSNTGDDEYKSLIVKLASDCFYETALAKGLRDNFFGAFQFPDDMPERSFTSLDLDYSLTGYIYPYAVISTGLTGGVVDYVDYTIGGAGSPVFLGEYGRYMPAYIKLFDGRFTCNGDIYHSIIAEYETIRVKAVLKPNGIDYLILKRIYYRNDNGNTLDVVTVHNNINTFVVGYPNSNNVGQGITWNFVDSSYRDLHIDYVYTDYASINFYDLRDNSPLDYLIYVFNASGYGSNTLGDGSGGANSIPVYDDVPTSYAFGSVFGLISQAFMSISNFLTFQVLPGVSLGTLLFIPLIVMIVIFIVWLIKR